MGQTLLEKVWDLHTVRTLPSGQSQLFIGLHLIHEVTTPQAFDMLRRRGVGVAFPERTYATVDHIVPTLDQRRPFADDLAEQMMAALERNCDEFGIRIAGLDSDRQGIVHVIGPELGLTQPGNRLCQPRRDHLRVPGGAVVRARGSRLREREAVVAVDGLGPGRGLRRCRRDRWPCRRAARDVGDQPGPVGGRVGADSGPGRL